MNSGRELRSLICPNCEERVLYYKGELLFHCPICWFLIAVKP